MLCQNEYAKIVLRQDFARRLKLAYYVRLMRKDDIIQVSEIDREAFPTMWPPANYERELQTRLAHYIVAYEGNQTLEKAEKSIQDKGPLNLVSRVQQLVGGRHAVGIKEPPLAEQQYIVGFAGFWMMADEAHLTNIAVRQSHRRQGIGELLLISTIDLALELKARVLTLEVRASNLAAQSLYFKYGFKHINVRRGYYTDNQESALIMATEDITTAAFQKRLNRLRKIHSLKMGIALYHIAH